MTVPERQLSLFVSVQHFPPYSGGAERQAEILASELSLPHRNTDVTVVTTRFDRALKKKEKLGRVSIRRTFTLTGRRVKIAINVTTAFLYFLSRGYRYDIVHCMCLSPFNLGAILGAKLWGRQTLVKICSLGSCGDIQKIKQLPLGFWFWRLYLLSDGFVAPTSEVADEVAAEGVPRDKIAIVPNILPRTGPAAEKQVLRRDLGLPDRLTLLYVGRLSPDKNLDVILDACANVLSHHDVSLVFVGDGPLAGHIRDWRAGLDHPESVFLAGYQADPAQYYAAADILVFTSLQETFGNVIIEGMSQGLAVMTTRVGVVKEWVDVDDILVTIDGENAQQLQCKLETLLASPREQQRLGANARRFMKGRYNIEHVADQYQEIYTNLLDVR
jgi:glycosyltransferase involved in cell wall biosynthesis